MIFKVVEITTCFNSMYGSCHRLKTAVSITIARGDASSWLIYEETKIIDVIVSSSRSLTHPKFQVQLSPFLSHRNLPPSSATAHISCESIISGVKGRNWVALFRLEVAKISETPFLTVPCTIFTTHHAPRGTPSRTILLHEDSAWLSRAPLPLCAFLVSGEI
jgi:hypothetical protein